MRYKLFGNSGLRVSELCLGAWTFGAPAEIGPPKEECERVFRAYAEQGGNFLDVANNYSEGESEKWLGEFIGAERERFALGTKFTLSMRYGDLNACGNHRKNIVQSVEASLRRLKTDYIDLYWLHQWDFTTPVDEIMRALDDLVRAGKVLYVGISDAPAWIVAQANTLAALRGWTPFVALQIEYSLIERTVERELLPMARAFGLAVTPWGVIGGGMLGGRYDTAADPMAVADSRRAATNATRITERTLQIARKAREIAQAIGRSPAQVALNWRSGSRDGLFPSSASARKASFAKICGAWRLPSAMTTCANSTRRAASTWDSPSITSSTRRPKYWTCAGAARKGCSTTTTPACRCRGSELQVAIGTVIPC